MSKAITPEQLIRKYTQGKLCAHPEFYSGRGNNPGDLNSEHLEMLYTGINIEVGGGAAKAFVNMVAQMTADASATTFLIAFGRFAREGWQLSPHTVPKSEVDSVTEALSDLNNRSGARAVSSVAPIAIFGLLGRAQPAQEGDGYTITGDFLAAHAKELDQPAVLVNRRSSYGIW